MLMLDVRMGAITTDYNGFQRECVKFLFSRLPSMTGLVNCFGNKALDSFCRAGRLDDGTMKRIRDCEGPATVSADSGDAMDED